MIHKFSETCRETTWFAARKVVKSWKVEHPKGWLDSDNIELAPHRRL